MFSGSLAIGATQLVYDGSPFYPQKDILVKFVAKHKYFHNFLALTHRATSWGTSPKYLAELQASGIVPSTPHAVHNSNDCRKSRRFESSPKSHVNWLCPDGFSKSMGWFMSEML
jgi:hypothetical protein